MSGFANPIVGGGGALVYPSVHSPNFNVANPAASPSPSWAILKSGLAYFFGIVVSGGTITGPDYILSPLGFFLYNGVPSAANPPIAWISANGTDPFGTALPSTTGVAGTGTFQAGDTIITPSGFFFYSGTPALGNLAYSITLTNVADKFGNVTGIGFCSYATGQQASLTAGQLNFGTAAGSTFLAANANGTMKATTATGYSGTLRLGGISTTLHTVTQATLNPLSDAWPVPANDPDALTCYWLTVGLSGMTGTAQETLEFALTGFGATLATFTIGASEWPVSTPFAGELACKIPFNTATQVRSSIVGNLNVSGANQLTVGGTLNAGGGFGTMAGLQTVTVTPAQTVQLQAQWGSALVGATIAGGYSIMERIGA
jgi:hypothetical protein